jgi:hypothetical protein
MSPVKGKAIEMVSEDDCRMALEKLCGEVWGTHFYT